MSEISKALQVFRKVRRSEGNDDGEKDIRELLRQLEDLKSSLEDDEQIREYDPQGPKKIGRLEELFEHFSRTHQFSPGDIVKWKDGFKNRKFPRYNEPGVVIHYRPNEDVFSDEEDAGSPYFREPLDLLIALLDEDGDFLLYHFDARRFEPWGGI